MTDDVLPVTGTVADNGFSNDTTLTIAGTAEAGSTVTIYDTDGTRCWGQALRAAELLDHDDGAGPGQPYADRQGNGCGRQPGRGLDRVPRHHRHLGAGCAGDHIGDGRRAAGDGDGCGQRRLERRDADDYRHGGGRQHGHDLRYRRHHGARDRRCDRRSFSITTTALSQGSHTLTARATDAAGNQGAASTAYHVTIDTSAPAAPAITSVTDDVLPVTGTVADNGFSNDATLTIAGTAEAGSTVTLYDTDGTTVLGTGVATGGATRSRRRRWAGQPYAHRQGNGYGRQPGRGLDRVPRHHRHLGAGCAGDHIGDGRRAAGDGDGCGQRLLERRDADDRRHGGGRQHGHDLRHRRHDGARDRRCERRSYSITTSALGQGSHTLTAKATDTAGNQGAASTAFHVTIDTSAPAAPAITSVTDDVLPVTGTVADNGFSNDATLTIAGTAEAGSTVTLYDTDGTTVLGTGVASGGAFSITTTALGQGSHTLTAKATDTAGNQGAASTAFHVTIDTSAPAAPAITSVTDDVLPVTGTVADNGFSNDATLTIAGTAEAGSTVTLYDTDGTTVLGTGVASGGAFSITTTALGQGSHTLTAKATDTAGNQGAASTAFHVTIDTSAPAAPAITSVTDDVLPVTGTVADNGFSNDATLTIAGTAEAGSTVTIYDTDGTTVLGTGVASGGAFSITTTALGQGSHTITARATDTAGNQGAASTAFHVTIDTSAPAAPAITSVTDDVRR